MAIEEPTQFSAFISYASTDASKANEICSSLEARGFRCWIAPRDIRTGHDYGDEIIRGIQQSRSLVLILSEAANQSPFVKREVERAVTKRKPVFPIRIEEILPSPSLELFISSTHWIDAWSGKFIDQIDRLAKDLMDDSDVQTSQISDRIPDQQRIIGWAIGVGAVVAVAIVAIAISLMGQLHRKASQSSPTLQPKLTAGASPPPQRQQNYLNEGKTTAEAVSGPSLPAITPLESGTANKEQIRRVPGSVGGDSQFRKLGEEADAAVATAGKLSLEGQPLFQDIIEDVEKLGLTKVRTERKEAAQNVSNLFGTAAARLRIAASKCEEAAQHHTEEQMKAFMVAKAKAYRLGAEARELNQQFMTVIMNDPAVKIDDILPKLQSLAARRDAANKAALDEDAEANEMVKILKK